MKYAIIIPDGCADEPQASLGGKTPLQAAHKPNMDRIAQTGIVGRANNVPQPLTPASDVATLSLFGYDPLVVYTGRAPLETAAMGIPLGPNDWAVRCNLVTVEEGLMRDFTAQHISSEEARELIADLQSALGSSPLPHPPTPSPKEGEGEPDRAKTEPNSSGSPLSPRWERGVGGVREAFCQLEFHPGVQYRNILVCRCGLAAPFSVETRTQPPHDIPDRPVEKHLPQGPGADLLISLMESSKSVLANHAINKARRAAGKRPATQIWLWGQGRAPSLRPFSEVYGKSGAILSAVDLVRGVGVLLGWKRIDVPGATGYLDTDYSAKGKFGVAALADHDLVCVHIEAPDEASHEGKADEKVKALEQIDRHIIGPLLEALPSYGEWRILVSPDHRTTLSTRAHAYGAVPFALAGTGITARNQPSYDENVAAASDLAFEKGHDLMKVFLA